MPTRLKTSYMPRYMKLLLAFSLLIGAIPVLALGGYSYYIAAGDVEQKTKDSTMQFLVQTQLHLEQIKKTTEQGAIQFAVSPLVTSALNGPLNVAEHVQVRDLYSGLYSMQALSGIDEGYLINQPYDWALNFTSLGKRSELPAEVQDKLSSYAKHPSNLFWDTGYAADSAAFEQQGDRRDVVRLVLKLPILPFTEQPKGFLLLELNKPKLRDILLDNVNEQPGHVYVLDREGVDFLASSDEEAAPYLKMNQRIVEQVRETGDTVGTLHGRADGQDMLFSYRQSPYNGWIYVSAVSLREITRQTGKIAIGTLVACSVVLAVVGLLAWGASRRMYSPIRRLADMTKAVSTGDPGGRDEFTSLERRFHVLFSDGQQLRQQMQDQFTQLQEFMMLKLFAGQLPEHDFAYRSRMYGFPEGWKRLVVLTLQIDTLQDTRYREHDRELLLFAIHNMAGELIPAHQRFSPVLLHQSQVTLIASQIEDEAELKTYMYSIAELIKAKVQEFLQVTVSLGISRSFADVSSAVHAYHESLEALKARIYLGSGMILHVEDVQAGTGQVAAAAYAQIKWTEDQLLQSLKLGDAEKAEQWLDQYMTALKESQRSPNDSNVLMLQLVSRMYQIVQEQGGSVRAVLGDQAAYSRLMQLNTLDDIADWLKRSLIGPISLYLSRQAESRYVGLAQTIIGVIRQRYDQEVTLEGIAAELNFHPVYLGRVFKKETGMTFSEYLADYRMSLAKEWLQTTNLKISDISEKLNYSNTTAFIRIFRKVVGMTPGQYRELHQHNP
ncbi:helix-turn-helix domain-containing protein [Paenibacillus puerhi]|uniref:helix-turn-helix domain-containing protein n=1 Tax=Paenibacillus puerhi TaxID=2692622 RepID=UPI00135861CA|nr:helix-turn-helix domain-containing protein [Paenibacillus puerhi]